MAKEKKQAEREQLREKHFPKSDWYNRETRKGFAQPPRALPLLRRLINDLSKTRAGDLYLALWFNDWGQSVIEVVRAKSLVYQAGSNAESRRSDRNWDSRLRWLANNGFIGTMSHNFEAHGLIVLMDPYNAVLRLYKENPNEPIVKEWMPKFESFCSEWSIDLFEVEEEVAPKKPTKVAGQLSPRRPRKGTRPLVSSEKTKSTPTKTQRKLR